MNATPAIFRPQSADAGQSNARAPTPAASDQANTRDFAGALSDAGSKPVRAPRGRHLPGSGNQSPPAAGSPAPVSVATPAARNDVATATPPGTAPASALAGAAVGAAAVGAAAGATPQISQAMAQLTPKVGGDALPADAVVADVADAKTTATTPGAVPGGPPVEIPQTERSSAAQSAQPAQANVVKPAVNLPTGKAAIAAATSDKSPGSGAVADSDATLAAPSACADADASAQAGPAALAQNIRAPEADSSNTVDDLATPADALPAAPPVPGAARSAAASIAAAVTAATKASVTSAVPLAAGTGAVDKHARDSNADTLLKGASSDGSDGSAGAAQLLAPIPANDTTPAPTLKVAAGVDSGEFGQGVADRVSLMMDSNLTSAKLQVNPPALGPIEVRIALQGGHAQVWFTSHSAVTRDALESSAPRLREMLGAQGFGQVSVDISQRSFQERSPTPRGYEATAAIGMDTGSPAAATAIARAANALLDAYA